MVADLLVNQIAQEWLGKLGPFICRNLNLIDASYARLTAWGVEFWFPCTSTCHQWLHSQPSFIMICEPLEFHHALSHNLLIRAASWGAGASCGSLDRGPQSPSPLVRIVCHLFLL